MPKRTMFTNVTPLPPGVGREVAVAMLHNHDEMIELNPLVIEHHPIKTPRDAPADEFLDCVWQELTDKIHYLPGGLVKGKVSYKACFHDTPNGLQTHIYAPMGLDIREKWSIGGNLPGEPPEARELGLNTPREGLYLREDCDMKCSLVLTGFVRKNLDNAHKVLVERILKKAVRVEEHLKTISPTTSGSNVSTTGQSGIQPGSHMSRSLFINTPMTSPRQESFSSPLASPVHSQYQDNTLIHPAFRNEVVPGSSHGETLQTPPPYHTLNGQIHGYSRDVKQSPYQQQPQNLSPNRRSSPTQSQHSQPSPTIREFMAELPGSTPEYNTSTRCTQQQNSSQHERPVSELSSTETSRTGESSPLFYPAKHNERVSLPESSQTSNHHLSSSSRPSSRHPSDHGSERHAELPPLPVVKPPFQQFQAQRSGMI